MLLISVLAAAVIFLLLLALYNVATTGRAQVSRRVRRIGENQRQRSGGSGGFWEELARSGMSAWAKNGANRYGKFFPKRAWFDLQAERSGLPVTGSEYSMLIFSTALASFALVFLLTFNFVRAAIIALLWCGMTSYYLYHMGQKRIKAFNAQLGDAIMMMSNAVRAGFTFQQAMDIVAKEMAAPISVEFGRALNESKLGIPLEEALAGISKRVTSDDFDLIATAVVIQRQVGGNLTQILETVGQTIRERIKLKGEIRQLTAEGIASGWLIGLMPILLAAFMLYTDPKYFDGMLELRLGKYILIGAVVSEGIGALIIKKLIDIRI
jgi:tight adherence protein B